MDFELSRENRMILDSVKHWTARECQEEAIREWDEAGGPPENIQKKFIELGFTGLCIPEAYEGEGPDNLASVLVTETLASHYPALARAYGAITFFGGAVFSKLGDETQKNQMLPAFARGQRSAAVFVQGADRSNEAENHSLPMISGHDRNFVSGNGRCVGSASAKALLVFPAFPANSKESEIRIYCTEINRAGLHITAEDTLGYKGNTGARVSFQDMEVRSEDILSNIEQNPMDCLSGVLYLELGAEALGIARGSLEYATNYAKQRIQFGRPIIRFPAIRDMVVQNECDIQAAAMLLYRAAASADRGRPWCGDAARAYYAACRIARKTALDGLQILGGYGYTMEFAAQRYVRDALSLYNTGAESERLKAQLSAQMGI